MFFVLDILSHLDAPIDILDTYARTFMLSEVGIARDSDLEIAVYILLSSPS